VLPTITKSQVTPLIHVFSKQDLHSIDPPSASRTLLQDETQLALLNMLPEADRPRFKHILSHYASKTVPTLFFGDIAQAAWSEAIPLLATQHQFVLHGILAIGSLHLSRLAGTALEEGVYRDMAATQLNTGMIDYRKEIQKSTTTNAEALFAFSSSITSYSFQMAGTECKLILGKLGTATDGVMENRDVLITTLLQSICGTFRSMRSVLVIFVPCWHHIRSGILEPVVSRDWWPTRFPVSPSAIVQDHKLQQLETLWSQPGKVYEYLFDTFRSALKSLREAFALVSRLVDTADPDDTSGGPTFDWASVVSWPVELSLEFLLLLEQRRLEPWVLVAHYGMLFATVKNNIWLDGLGPSIVATAALVIGEEHWNWIEWPAAVVQLDLQELRRRNIKPQSSCA
jgi:hypothetical protein